MYTFVSHLVPVPAIHCLLLELLTQLGLTSALQGPSTCAFKSGCLMSHNWLHTPDCKKLNALLNTETSNLIQNCHIYTGNLNRETSGNSKNAFLRCGDVSEN
jgi:hypothetical protein